MPEMGVSKVVTVRVMTTTERDALEAVEGMVIFNSTTDQLEEYDGATWQAVGQVILDTHIADLDAHTRNIVEQFRTGDGYIFPPGRPDTTVTLTANRLYAVPIIIPRTMTFDRIATRVRTEAADKSIRLGIYADGTNLYPGALSLDAGVVSAATTGDKAVTIDKQLTKGLYWLAMVSDGTPTVSGAYRVARGILGESSGNLDNQNMIWWIAHTYGALPDPFTADGSLGTTGIVIALRPSSLD